MRHAKGSFTLILITILATAGCKTASKPEHVPGAHSNQEIIATSAVDTSYPRLTRVISTPLLVDHIMVVNPKLGTQGKFAKAQVTVQNLTENRYELEYQYQWEDAAGFSAGTPRPWKRFVLEPKEASMYSELALNENAKRAIFTVRIVTDTFIELNKQLEQD
jgi:uncharacterized protein YcfL